MKFFFFSTHRNNFFAKILELQVIIDDVENATTRSTCQLNVSENAYSAVTDDRNILECYGAEMRRVV